MAIPNIELNVRGFLINGNNVEYFYLSESIDSNARGNQRTDRRSVPIDNIEQLNELIYSINPSVKKLMSLNPDEITCYIVGYNTNDLHSEEHVLRLHGLINKTLATPGTIYDPVVLVALGKEPLELKPEINELFSQHLVKDNQSTQEPLALFQQAITDITNNTASSIQASLMELAISKNDGNEKKQLKCLRQKLIFQEKKREFDYQLNELFKKAKELEDNGYTDVAKKASELHTSLNDYSKEYFSNPWPETYPDFKKQSLGAIEKATPVLSTHRSLWKVILGNIILAILGLGVLYGVAVLINRNFFFAETKSKQILNSMEKMVRNDELAQTNLDTSIFKI